MTSDRLPPNPNPTRIEREIVLSRVLDAPPELVWKAWTDPEQWSNGGGRTASHDIQKMEVKPAASGT